MLEPHHSHLKINWNINIKHKYLAGLVWCYSLANWIRFTTCWAQQKLLQTADLVSSILFLPKRCSQRQFYWLVFFVTEQLDCIFVIPSEVHEFIYEIFFGQGKQRRDCRNWRELRFAVSSRRCQMSRSLKWFIISSVQVHCLATEYFVTNQQLFFSEIQALQNELTPKVFQNTQTWTWRQIALCVTDFKNCFPGREIIFAHHLGCF